MNIITELKNPLNRLLFDVILRVPKIGNYVNDYNSFNGSNDFVVYFRDINDAKGFILEILKILPIYGAYDIEDVYNLYIRRINTLDIKSLYVPVSVLIFDMSKKYQSTDYCYDTHLEPMILSDLKNFWNIIRINNLPPNTKFIIQLNDFTGINTIIKSNSNISIVFISDHKMHIRIP